MEFILNTNSIDVKFTVKMDCRYRNRQWKILYFYRRHGTCTKKNTRSLQEKCARKKIEKNEKKILYEKIRTYVIYQDIDMYSTVHTIEFRAEFRTEHRPVK